MGDVIPNPEGVADVLKRMFVPGDVFEIRALEATRPGLRRPHIESGYFDYDHIDVVGAAVAELSFAKGVYYTPNPVLPSLLARAANRIRPVGMDPTTKDEEILSRRWLLVDCDPVRPAGISSTDEEHEFAHARARELRDGLSSMGWPQPIYCDSGNGAQLLYRIDLPRDDVGATCATGLVKRVLGVFATTDDDKVKVDQAVSNPARIWRLPGTMNCRGDHIPDRPHRLAQVIDLPDTLTIVTKEQLEEVAGQTASGTSSGRGTSYGNIDISKIAGPAPVAADAFDIDKWIAQYCPEVEGPTNWQGGRKWIFPVCPFNELHTNRSAVLIQQLTGAIAFRCHHNGCRDYGWKELRDLKEPGRTIPKTPAPMIQPSVLTPTSVIIVEAPDLILPPEPVIRIPDPGPVPEALLRIPGFISNVMDFTLENAPYPNVGLAFCGALALQSYLCARKICDFGDLRPNIYILALASSGTGKDFPRKVNTRVLFEIGHLNALGDKFASGEGIQDALLRSGAMLFQNDEMDYLIRQIKNDPEGKRESIANILMTLYTSAASIYPLRVKAGQTESIHIDQPHITLFGTATPEFFYESLDRNMLCNGFFSRLIIVDVDTRGKGQDAGSVRHLPDSILRVARWWSNFQPGTRNGNLLALHPEPRIVLCQPTALEQVQLLRRQAEVEHDLAHARHDTPAKTAWTRTHENAMKLAMLYACSANHENPSIDLSAVEWAQAFAMHQTRRQLFMAGTYVAENPFHALCLKVTQKLQEQSDGRLDHSTLLRRMKLSAKALAEVLETMVYQGTLIRESVTRGGKTRLEYRLV